MDAKKVVRSPQDEIERLCQIDLDNLTLALRDQAATYGSAYEYYEAAKTIESRAKWDYEKAKSTAFSELRENGRAIGAAKEEAEMAEGVVVAYEAYLKAEKVTGIFHALLKGLEHRKDMLIQLSSREKRDVV